MEHREAAREPSLSPTLLRTRIDIFSRRIRLLEEEMAELAREIEDREARGEDCLRLRHIERENDALLLEQLRLVQQMRQELERIEPTPDDIENEEKDDEERKHRVNRSLYFQLLGESTSEIETQERIEQPLEREFQRKYEGLPDSECSICLEGYKVGQEISWSKDDACPHIFHAECLTLWLGQRDDCPLCRNKLLG